jgi:hypothetical protein
MPAIAEKGQTCRVVETVELTDINSNQSTQHVFSLSDFSRASNIAPNFMWYRAVKVVYTYDPLYNTFQDGVNAASKPYMYTVMNRSQFTSVNNMRHLEQFQCAGARPITLTTQKKIAYRPNWCSPGLLQIRVNANGSQDFTQGGLQTQYGWLATQSQQINLVPADGTNYDQFGSPASQSRITPGSGLTTYNGQSVLTNMVQYNGHFTYVDQKFTGGETPVDPVARLTATVIWEFKGAKNPALNIVNSPAPEAT